MGGANAVTERCAEREKGNGKTFGILILVKQGKLTFLEFIKLNAVWTGMQGTNGSVCLTGCLYVSVLSLMLTNDYPLFFFFLKKCIF